MAAGFLLLLMHFCKLCLLQSLILQLDFIFGKRFLVVKIVGVAHEGCIMLHRCSTQADGNRLPILQRMVGASSCVRH